MSDELANSIFAGNAKCDIAAIADDITDDIADDITDDIADVLQMLLKT